MEASVVLIIKLSVLLVALIVLAVRFERVMLLFFILFAIFLFLPMEREVWDLVVLLMFILTPFVSYADSNDWARDQKVAIFSNIVLWLDLSAAYYFLR